MTKTLLLRHVFTLLICLLIHPALGADLSALQTALEKPGKHQLSLSIGDVDQQANIPITAIVGAQSGPTLLVLSGIHGSEYSPIVASQRLATTLEPEIISGKIIFVHIANMPAYLGRTVYTSPADGKNLNRLFPGNPSGTLSARIAFLLTDQLYPLADAVLDMHSGDGNEDLNPIWVGYYAQAGNPDVIARSKALAMAFGFEHIIAFQWELTDRADAIWAGSAAVALGIPSIDVEAGGKNVVDADAVASITAGVRRTLAHLGMTTEVFAPLQQQKMIHDRSWISAPQSGSWIALKQAGDRVKQDELLGYLTDFHGRKVFEARAPKDGLLLLIVTAPPIQKGETVAIVARTQQVVAR